MAQPVLGTVTEFDEQSALGVVVLDGGGAFQFHSTAVTDRSRTVTVGQRVSVEVAATHGGIRHCREVVKL